VLGQPVAAARDKGKGAAHFRVADGDHGLGVRGQAQLAQGMEVQVAEKMARGQGQPAQDLGQVEALKEGHLNGHCLPVIK